MSHFFADSSALVKNYVDETGSKWLKSQLSALHVGGCAICRITHVEVAAALTRRSREGSLATADADQAFNDLRRDVRAVFTVTEITPEVLSDAVEMARRHGLRACDAVQLAALLSLARELERGQIPPPVLLCSDRALLQAAAAEGSAVDDPNLHP